MLFAVAWAIWIAIDIKREVERLRAEVQTLMAEREVGGDQVAIPLDLLLDVDAFIAGEPDPKPSRPDAIRRLLHDELVRMGLRKP